MSPEQASGGGEVDPRADVWAFCVVLYEMITGSVPFDGETATLVLIAVVSKHPTPTTELAAGDDALWKILERGLQKDPDDRYQSMRELGQALARWALDHGADTDVAGTSLSVHWLAERRARPLSDIPRAHEPTHADLTHEAPPLSQKQPSHPEAPPSNPEDPRSGGTWPPRPVARQHGLPSLEDLVRPVTLPPELAGGRAKRWFMWLVLAAIVAAGVGVYMQRENPEVHWALERIGIVDPAPSTPAPTASTATAKPAEPANTAMAPSAPTQKFPFRPPPRPKKR